jgi:hypothetical protein
MDTPNIPQKILDLANSVELGRMCSKIGEEFGLNIDQIGEMDAQVRWVLRGHAQASTFSSDIQSLLDINADKARMITNRINTEVFQTLQSLTEAHETETSLQAIEKAGDFEIERPMSNMPVRKSLNLLQEDVSVEASPNIDTEPIESEVVEEKRDIMAGIENPEPSTMKTAPEPMQTSAPAQTYPNKEPLVEQLLRGSTAMPEQKVVRGAALGQPKRPPIVVPPRPAGNDPYREALE